MPNTNMEEYALGLIEILHKIEFRLESMSDPTQRSYFKDLHGKKLNSD